MQILILLVWGLVKKVKVKVTWSCLTVCKLMDCSRQTPLPLEFSR